MTTSNTKQVTELTGTEYNDGVISTRRRLEVLYAREMYTNMPHLKMPESLKTILH